MVANFRSVVSVVVVDSLRVLPGDRVGLLQLYGEPMMTEVNTLVEIVQPEEGAIVDVRISVVLQNGQVGQRTYHFDPGVTLKEMFVCMGVGGPVQFVIAVPIGGVFEKQVEELKADPTTLSAHSGTSAEAVLQSMYVEDENRRMLERCFAKDVFEQ